MSSDNTEPVRVADAPAEAAQLADRFMRLAKQLRHRSATDLAPLGLTPSQERALRTIARTEPVRIVHLAARLDIVPRSATTVVDALEQQGLVTRDPDPVDRRSVLVSLSPAGRDRIRRIQQSRRRATGDLFLTLDPQDRADLSRILTAVQQSLDDSQ